MVVNYLSTFSEMDPCHLKEDELEYELALRQIPKDSPRRIDRLVNRLQEEKLGDADRPDDNMRLTRQSVTQELKECDIKLMEIVRDLDEAIRKADDNLSEQGQSRLIHLAGRVSRLESIADGHAAVSRLVSRIREVGGQFVEARDSLGSGEQGAVGQDVLESTHDNNEDAQLLSDDLYIGVQSSGGVRSKTTRFSNPMPDKTNSQSGGLRGSSTNMIGSLANLFTSVSKNNLPSLRDIFDDPAIVSIQSKPPSASSAATERQNRNAHPQRASGLIDQNNQGLSGGHRIHQWSLRFDGRADSMDAEDFIFRVERQARLYGVTSHALAIGIESLLTGRASQWYWTYQRQQGNATWAEIKQAFLRRYAPHKNTDFEIRAKIEKRHQLPGELFSDYCQDIEALACRLIQRMQEFELVEILRRNMNITLRKALWRERINNVDELLHVCNAYENLCQEDDNQRRMNQRPSARVSEIVYDNQNIVSDINLNTHDHESLHHSMTVEAVQPVANRNDLTVCWNCKDIGHSFIECKVSRQHIFCYSCGASGVLKAQCPKCSSGNSRRDGTSAGGSRPISTALFHIIQRTPPPQTNPTGGNNSFNVSHPQ